MREIESWPQLLTAYHQAEKRVLFFDYDGTLVPFYDNPQLAKPSAELIHILTRLVQNPHNEVVIISGRDRKTLHQWLGQLDLRIIAEHGAWIKEKNFDWCTMETMNTDWKSEVGAVLQSYVRRLAGAFIEEKEYSLAWHYRKSDPAQGSLLVTQLKDRLRTMAEAYELQILDGNHVLEVRRRGVDKGVAALRCLTKGNVFIMAIGDDRTDEDLFEALPDSAYTIKVGEGLTAARFRLPNQIAVLELLKKISGVKGA